MKYKEYGDLSISKEPDNTLEFWTIGKKQDTFVYLTPTQAQDLRDYLSSFLDTLECPECGNKCDPEQIGSDGCCMCTANDQYYE